MDEDLWLYNCIARMNYCRDDWYRVIAQTISTQFDLNAITLDVFYFRDRRHYLQHTEESSIGMIDITDVIFVTAIIMHLWHLTL